LNPAQQVTGILGESVARDILTHRPKALEERGRSAGIGIDVIGGDRLADDGLSRKADHQGKQREHCQLLELIFDPQSGPIS
jgi:hypothetical protein